MEGCILTFLRKGNVAITENYRGMTLIIFSYCIFLFHIAQLAGAEENADYTSVEG